VNSIQPIRFCCCNEELTSVRILPRIGHAQHSRLVVTVQKVFIGKRITSAVYASLSSTVSLDKVSTLQHKVLNDTVKCRSLVTDGLFVDEKFASAELTKIFTSFGALTHMSEE
jgi:hypothetical protein